jgi:hypothetical protein
MSILKRIRKGVKTRFSEKSKTKNSQTKTNTTTKPKKRELYTDNEDLGFC